MKRFLLGLFITAGVYASDEAPEFPAGIKPVVATVAAAPAGGGALILPSSAEVAELAAQGMRRRSSFRGLEALKIAGFETEDATKPGEASQIIACEFDKIISFFQVFIERIMETTPRGLHDEVKTIVDNCVMEDEFKTPDIRYFINTSQLSDDVIFNDNTRKHVGTILALQKFMHNIVIALAEKGFNVDVNSFASPKNNASSQ